MWGEGRGGGVPLQVPHPLPPSFPSDYLLYLYILVAMSQLKIGILYANCKYTLVDRLFRLENPGLWDGWLRGWGLGSD